PAFAQTPPMTQPVDRVTLQEAVERALKSNPNIAAAAQAVLRAEGMLPPARAATMPNVNLLFINQIVDTPRGFNGVVIQPRDQSTLGASLSMPGLAPARWLRT